MYFTGNDSYQSFLVFSPMLSSLTLDSNKNFTNWISTGIWSEKVKPFNTNLESMVIIANDKVILKSNNSVLLKTKKEYKNSKKQKVQDIFIEAS